DDRDREPIEEVLAAGDGGAAGVQRARSQVRPRRVLGEHDRAEVWIAAGAGRRRWVASERIVGPERERPIGQDLRTALSAGDAQVARRAIDELRGVVADLVGDDLVPRVLVDRCRALRVA